MTVSTAEAVASMSSAPLRVDQLLCMAKAARDAQSSREVAFLLVNESHTLAPYRLASFWTRDAGLHTLSGVLLPEANAPYAQWLAKVCHHLAEQPTVPARTVTAAVLPDDLARDWNEWWPENALWLAMPGDPVPAGLILVRDDPWGRAEQGLLREWADIGWHAYAARLPSEGSWVGRGWRALYRGRRRERARAWWKRSGTVLGLAAAAAMALPVQLTVLAPGELVPSQPVVVRSPLEGVIDAFHVQPNQTVQVGQPLLGFDEALIVSRLKVAEQSLETAATEYRQVAQQALSDAKARPHLAQLTGRIEEKRAELAYLREQLQRARILAPAAGVVLMDDPSEWIGKPVNVGERLLRIASPGDVEIEVWLALADGVALPRGAPVRLYLNASPLEPVNAKLRMLGHEAVQRPDGSFAYRVRATLDAPTAHRIGLKGTAKLQGERVWLGYWVMRRPLAWVRTTLGV